jgi:hypothetical protein
MKCDFLGKKHPFLRDNELELRSFLLELGFQFLLEGLDPVDEFIDWAGHNAPLSAVYVVTALPVGT